MRYVIVGAGPAGVVAAETLRARDRTAEIVLLGDEPDAPYGRMALPYLIAGRIDEGGVLLRRDPERWADALGVQRLRIGARAVDPAARRLTLVGGEALGYDRLLVATGSRPRRPPEIEGLDRPEVVTCWTLADARRLLRLTAPGTEVALLGAGFIASTLLDALLAREVRLTVVEQAPQLLPRMLDAAAAGVVQRRCEQAGGVRVLTGRRAVAVEGGGRLRLADGEQLRADVVLLAAGVEPNTELLASAPGVELEGGVLVDSRLRTGAAEIYAAGDVARGPTLGGGRSVHAIQPTAAEHGRVAALNMAGLEARYGGSVVMNVLETCGLVSCSVGRWGAEGDVAEALDAARGRYLRLVLEGDRLIGAVAVGHEAHLGALRGLIAGGAALGPWRERLLRDPSRVMEAHVASTLPWQA